MLNRKLIDVVTNIFGSIAGFPQLIHAFNCYQTGDMACTIEKGLEGIGILVMAYFIGKKAVDLPS